MKTIKKTLFVTALLGLFNLSLQATPTKVGMQVMVNAFFKHYNGGKTPKVIKKDLGNGYMEYEALQNGYKLNYALQFAYYLTNSGKEILASSTPNCMQSCASMLNFFQMVNGKLQEIPDPIVGMGPRAFYARIGEQAQIHMSANEKSRQDKGEMALYSTMIYLPQHGTTILVKKESRVDRNQIVVAKLRYNLSNGKFNFVGVPKRSTSTDYSGTYSFGENKGKTNTIPISYMHTITIKKENGQYIGNYELSGYQMHANFDCDATKEGKALVLKFKSLGEISMVKGLKPGQKILKLTPQGLKAQVYFTKGYPLNDWVGKTYTAKKIK
ncbi:hypothetical protein BKI52_36545 [marine bacterium AO1-C]|nr:hypothetical protein BKI52_36545 [marine bacterium AO1-C]